MLKSLRATDMEKGKLGHKPRNSALYCSPQKVLLNFM